MSRSLILLKSFSRPRPALEALAVGLCLGFIDSNLANTEGFVLFGYLAAGAILGFRHAGRALACWPPLGVGLYAAHVVAIACGGKPPYVEENYRFAEQTLWVILPSGVGIMAGAGIRVGLSMSGVGRREDGPAIRFLPKTTREIAIAIACLGVSLGCLRQMMFPPTIYAVDYSEAKFNTIRVGMKPEQVLSILGPPLRKQSWSEGSDTWAYSDQYTYTSNYERRWVVFNQGVVQNIVNDYWYD